MSEPITEPTEKLDSVVSIIVDTPGKRFYKRQVKYLMAGDAETLVENNYHDDAVLTAAAFQIQGKKALKEHFGEYLKSVKLEKVLSTDQFVETDTTVLFEATVQSNHGVARVYDCFVLKEGKISYHFTGIK